MKLFSLAKNARLLDNTQFKAVLAQKKRFSDKLLTVYIAPNSCRFPRLGISIGKVCGKAVTRNRLKRLIREAFRLNKHDIPQSCDYLVMLSSVVIAKAKKNRNKKPDLKEITFQQVQASFLNLAKQAQKTLKNS